MKKRASAKPFMPQEFGAKADGTTDDSQPIRKAVDGAIGVNGAVVFPAGTYLVVTKP